MTNQVTTTNLAAQVAIHLAGQYPRLAKRDRNGNCELAEAIATAMHGSRWAALPEYPTTFDQVVAAVGIVIASWD